MENWNIYTKDRIQTDKIIQRGEPMSADEFHLVVHICLINSEQQMLIQQRQPFKSGWSNKWDVTVGGSALVGETSAMTATRELEEEIGYAMDFNSIRPKFTINFNRGFDDFYVVQADVDIRQLRLQDSEVQAVKWASKEDIIQMIEDGLFIPYHLGLIELIFDMQQEYGTHKKRTV